MDAVVVATTTGVCTTNATTTTAMWTRSSTEYHCRVRNTPASRTRFTRRDIACGDESSYAGFSLLVRRRGAAMTCNAMPRRCDSHNDGQ
jgi:hypothetical protein